MNKGIFGFPRNAALEARSLTARTVTAETVNAQTVSAASTVTAPTLAATNLVRTTGASPSSTGIRLVNDADLGSLFLPASYTAVQSVSVSNGGIAAGSISASISGNHLSISHLHNCACDCSSCP